LYLHKEAMSTGLSNDSAPDPASRDKSSLCKSSQSNGVKMSSHDPLCDSPYDQVIPSEHCISCEVIAMVREDERAKTLKLAIETVSDLREDHIRWYRVALQDAADALRELRHTAPPVDTTN
jgi:hypothetical protein